MYLYNHKLPVPYPTFKDMSFILEEINKCNFEMPLVSHFILPHIK
jgi:hypothetical protein